MKVDLAGKIRNTQLPRSKALLPMFEAVVNAFQAIEEAGDRAEHPRIDILVERDPVLAESEIDGPVNGFTITDNGIGFTDANVESFFTSDTRYKVPKGGKGIGRFVWLKAFQHAEIESHFGANGKLMTRAFKFTTDADQPEGPATPSSKRDPETTVRLVKMQAPYKEVCPVGSSRVDLQACKLEYSIVSPK